MAQNAANDISWYMALDIARKEDLSDIRHWKNLRIAFEPDRIWVKGFDYVQLHAVEVKSIPYKTLFYEKGGKLFPQHSLLPTGSVPDVLWTPIDRGLPVKLPSFNHNYFGIHQKLHVTLVPAEHETAPLALVTPLQALLTYVEAAPALRLEPLRWAVVNESFALIMGEPLLPLNGPVFYKNGGMLLPAGFAFNLHIVIHMLNQAIDRVGESWIIWQEDGHFFRVAKNMLQPLTRSSVRLTVQQAAAV